MTQNKIALVTGGSRGLGKNMSLSLAKKGNNIILTYQTKKDEAENVVEEIKKIGQKAIAVQLDVSNMKNFDGFILQIQTILTEVFDTNKIDFLVNNAGVGIHSSYADTTEEQFDSMVNIHLKSAFFLTQKTLPILNDGGAIVNISTGLARFTLPGYDAYAVMKGGIETLTKYQAKSLGNRGIRVNVVAPGAIETDFGGGAVRDNKDLNAFVASQTALGRVGKPDDIGSVVAFLCSDDAKWVNAQRIEASGGMFL
jgi:NAD(P)-dependent dehydrogenase (short-subunit alcohol dehydrogenase family)